MLSRTVDVLSDRGVAFLHTNSLLHQLYARQKHIVSACKPDYPRSDIRELTFEASIKGGMFLKSHDRRGINLTFSDRLRSNLQRHRQFRARVASDAAPSSENVSTSV